MSNRPNENIFAGIVAPIVELAALAQAAVGARVELLRHEASLRIRAIFLAIALAFAAIILIVLALSLAVKTVLMGFIALGLSPFQSHLAALGVTLLGIVILGLLARSKIMRACAPFELPVPRPIAPHSAVRPEQQATQVDVNVTIVNPTENADQNTSPSRPNF